MALTERLNLTASRELLDKLEQIKAIEDRSLADVMRRALEKYVEEYDFPQKKLL